MSLHRTDADFVVFTALLFRALAALSFQNSASSICWNSSTISSKLTSTSSDEHYNNNSSTDIPSRPLSYYSIIFSWHHWVNHTSSARLLREPKCIVRLLTRIKTKINNTSFQVHIIMHHIQNFQKSSRILIKQTINITAEYIVIHHYQAVA